MHTCSTFSIVMENLNKINIEKQVIALFFSFQLPLQDVVYFTKLHNL